MSAKTLAPASPLTGRQEPLLPTPLVSWGRNVSRTTPTSHLSPLMGEFGEETGLISFLLQSQSAGPGQALHKLRGKSTYSEMRALQTYFLENSKPCSPNCFMVLVSCHCCNEAPQNGQLTSSEGLREEPFLASASFWYLPTILGIPRLTTASLQSVPLSSWHSPCVSQCRCSPF